MNNPFKAGDKIVLRDGENLASFGYSKGKVYVVDRLHPSQIGEPAVYVTNNYGVDDQAFWSSRWRAAIMGKDYPFPQKTEANDLYPSGHLPDGSSVQKHSAGELYPYVVAYRDSTDPHSQRKYDVGLIGPRVVGTAWFTSFEDAVAAATALKA